MELNVQNIMLIVPKRYVCPICKNFDEEIGFIKTQEGQKVYSLNNFNCRHRFLTNKFKKEKVLILEKCKKCNDDFLVDIKEPKDIKIKTSICTKKDSWNSNPCIPILDEHIFISSPRYSADKVSKIVEQMQLKEGDKLIVEIKKV